MTGVIRLITGLVGRKKPANIEWLINVKELVNAKGLINIKKPAGMKDSIIIYYCH